MKVITSVKEMREYSRKARLEGKTVGLVPTMGYLHEGHMSLARASVKECDITVLSVFVNPSQFSEGEDLDRYPRDIERDHTMAEKEKVDVLFAPSAREMYPEGYSTYVEVDGAVTSGLCGKSRPGHFRGVTTVVAKLFNIIMPHTGYFGQKDAQQAAVIRKMAKDLDVPVSISIMPIVREADGLAMSSRNSYLSVGERARAIRIPESLDKAADMIKDGEVSPEKIKNEIKKILLRDDGLEVDYIETVDPETFKPVQDLRAVTLIAVAAKVGGTRLIDNTILDMRQGKK